MVLSSTNGKKFQLFSIKYYSFLSTKQAFKFIKKKKKQREYHISLRIESKHDLGPVWTINEFYYTRKYVKKDYLACFDGRITEGMTTVNNLGCQDWTFSPICFHRNSDRHCQSTKIYGQFFFPDNTKLVLYVVIYSETKFFHICTGECRKILSTFSRILMFGIFRYLILNIDWEKHRSMRKYTMY